MQPMRETMFGKIVSGYVLMNAAHCSYAFEGVAPRKNMYGAYSQGLQSFKSLFLDVNFLMGRLSDSMRKMCVFLYLIIFYGKFEYWLSRDYEFVSIVHD